MKESLNVCVYNTIELLTPKSAWGKGVQTYALELIEDDWIDLETNCNHNLLEKHLLNGANDWKQYSEGGCSLIYDGDIAKRLCNQSELKTTRNGQRQPNKNESWIDVQSRALFQAFELVYETMRKYQKGELKRL